MSNDIQPVALASPYSEHSTNDDDSVSSGSNNIGELQTYMEDDSKVPPSERVTLMISLCFAYIPGFTTDVEPYNNPIFNKRKKQHKPNRHCLKNEINRRDPAYKGHHNFNIQKFLEILQKDSFTLPDVDMAYLKKMEATYRKACEKKVTEDQHNNMTEASQPTTGRLTVELRLRLIEAMMSDEAKVKLLSTQECLSRQQLDARNSEMAVEDYFATVARVFNDQDWIPTTTPLPDVHQELATAIQIPLRNYSITREKVKEKYNEMKNHLHSMILKYERSGNGGYQRSEDAQDWGEFDEDLVMDGDDRKNFLPGGNQNLYYLLYFWYKLDSEGYLQFTLAVLPKNVKASSDEFSFVAKRPEKKQKTSESTEKLNDTLTSLSETMRSQMKTEYFEKLLDVTGRMAGATDRTSEEYKCMVQLKQHLQKEIQKYD